jgi:hypothetical protein
MEALYGKLLYERLFYLRASKAQELKSTNIGTYVSIVRAL